MIPDPGGLQAFLDGTNHHDAYEEFDIDGVTYSTRGTPPVRRGTLRSSLGAEVATVEFTILCGGGSSLLTAAMAGDLDGVPLVVRRVFVGGGSLVRFTGVVSDVRPTSVDVTIIGRSLIAEMTRKVPRRTFSTSCPWVFGSAECGSAETTPCDHTFATCTGTYGGFVTIPAERT